MTKSFLTVAAATSLLIPALAQDNTIRASISGEGGDGKCTFEVEVEGIAEVEIRGDQGYLRTVSGLPARWRRLVCNQPLPEVPTGFRFKGIDGRGSQRLIREPAGNQGVAVVQIEDPKNGSEGYTGDIIWEGSAARPAVSQSGAGTFGQSSGVWGGQGWGSSWGDSVAFTGMGNGTFDRTGGPRLDLRRAHVTVERSTGNVNASFDTDQGPSTLSFSGKVTRLTADTVEADLVTGVQRSDSALARGHMSVRVNPDRSIASVVIDGDVDNGSFRLNFTNR